MCTNQSAVSDGIADAETISLDASVRTDGLQALLWWDLRVGSYQRSGRPRAMSVFGDSEALIHMVMKGRSPHVRHVTGTH